MKTIDEYRSHLDATRRFLEKTIQQLTLDQWEMPVQSEGERWTARQLISHLVGAEPGMTVHIQRIIAGQQTLPDDFNLARWNRSRVQKMAELTPDELAAKLAESRSALYTVIDTLVKADLIKEGRHPSAGMLSIAGYLQRIGDHERLHATEIREALGLG